MNNFRYNNLKSAILKLRTLGLDEFSIGTSFLGEEVLGFHIGTKSGRQILVEAGIHAREYISTLAVIEEIKHLQSKSLNFGVYFIPLVNPDGARLVLDGASAIKNSKLKDFLLRLNGGSSDFSLWKANATGVDLNSNFNALWGLGVENKFTPGPKGFVGFFPNSEIENINLLKFLSAHPVSASLSIHTKGEVVYYGFDGLTSAELYRDEYIAHRLARALNFAPEKTFKSVGGFSDYVSEVYHIPAFTIELGSESLPHPITPDNLPQIASSFIGITERLNNILDELNL